jgi:transposase
MARPFKFTEDELKRAKELQANSKNEREARAAASFILMAKNRMSRQELANVFGVCTKTIHGDLVKIRNPEEHENKVWGGGNNHLLTHDQEAQFLDKYIEKAKAGYVITMPEIHREYNNRVGKNTPNSTFYRMLRRHNWRKVHSEPGQPNGDAKVPEEFQIKNSKWTWVKG